MSGVTNRKYMTTRRNAVLHHAPRNQMDKRENGREAAFGSAPIAGHRWGAAVRMYRSKLHAASLSASNKKARYRAGAAAHTPADILRQA
jgi:hypothetical protein